MLNDLASLALLNCTGYCTGSAHYAYEATVFLNGKYGNTIYISNIWPESNKPQILDKNPRWNRKNPRSREKFPSV